MSFNELDLVLLKHIISNRKNALEFISENDSKIFSSEVWNFANSTVNYIRNYKDLPTVRILSEKANNPNLAENIKIVWEQLDKVSVNEKEYKHDLEKVKKRFAEKQILSAKESLSKLEHGNIDINKTISELQKTIKNISILDSNKPFENRDIKDYLGIFVDKYNLKKNNPAADKGLMTGYSFIDFATNGLKQSDFVLIAGESGFGKSLFLNNIAIQVWLQNNKIFSEDPQYLLDNPIEKMQGKDIIYFSLEMPYEDCFNRLLSRLSGVPSRKIENAQLSKEEFEKVRKCLDFIKKYPYTFRIVDIAEASSNNLDAILIDSGENYDATFIDYLGIMKTNDEKEEQDWLRQGLVAQEVRRILRKYRIPGFSAVQLNRKSAAKESENDIGLHRLARSATIATHATHVIQIESKKNDQNEPLFTYFLIKNRKGPKGKGSCYKNLSCATLIDKPLEPEDNKKENPYSDQFKDQEDISKEMADLEL